MASLSAMCTYVLSALAETRRGDVWRTIPYVIQTFVTLTRSVEVQWLQSPLAFVEDEESLGKRFTSFRFICDSMGPQNHVREKLL